MAAPGPAAGGGGGGQARNPAIDNYLAGLPAQYLAEFRSVQAVIDNFFAYHHAGLSTHPAKPWEDPNVPPPGAAPPGRRRGRGFWDGQYSTDPAAAVERQARSRWFFRNRSGGSGRRPDAATGAVRAARRYIRAQRCNVRLQAVLGFGGNGVASLFELYPGPGRYPRKIVVKSMLRSGGTNLADEKGYNRVCSGHAVKTRVSLGLEYQTD